MSKKPDPLKNYLRPLKLGVSPSTHVLLWTEPQRDCTIGLRRSEVVSYRVTASDVVPIDSWTPLPGPDQLRDYLVAAGKPRQTLYVWLPGGWEDLIVSGLTQLLDSGRLEYKYLVCAPDKIVLRGRLEGRLIRVGSVGGWTGAGWDGWRDHTDARARDLYVESWLGLATLAIALSLPRVPPTAMSAARAVWRGILGPRVDVQIAPARRAAAAAADRFAPAVIPLRRRPQWVRQLERHACYGFVVQYAWRGYHPSRIYVVDLPQAYLSALTAATLPVAYDRRAKHLSPEALEARLQDRWGAALVHVRTEEFGYPLRRQQSVCLASGDYWTWLCGEELAVALRTGHVLEAEEVLLYYQLAYSEESVRAALSLRQRLRQNQGELAAAAWRSVYCHLVSSWAHWRREWKPVDRRSPVGPWGVWHAAEGNEGVVRHYRAVAGRVERLYVSDGSWYAYPPIYAAALSQLRILLAGVQLAAEGTGIIGVENDSVWLNEEGYERYRQCLVQQGVEPEKCLAKVVYDRAWFVDRHSAVVEREGRRYLRRPGVPATLPVDERGAVQWRTHLGLADHTPAALAGTLRGRTRRVVLRTTIPNSEEPGQPLPLWEHLVHPVLDQELLEPFLPRRITIEDI
jgi:hypothetical protein